MQPFKFSKTATDTPPTTVITGLFADMASGKKLSRQDKDILFNALYDGKGIYKIHGWQYDFKPMFKRYVVRHYEAWQWQTMYAPDATCIRRNTYTKTGLTEIHEIKNIFA